MSSVQCYVCDKKGPRNEFTRILNNGIKFECKTPECENIKKKREEEEMQERERIKIEQLKNKQLLEDNLIKVEYNKNFFNAEKQYRDANIRMVDPLTEKIVRRPIYMQPNLWIETNEELTNNDLMKIKCWRKENKDYSTETIPPTET